MTAAYPTATLRAFLLAGTAAAVAPAPAAAPSASAPPPPEWTTTHVAGWNPITLADLTARLAQIELDGKSEDRMSLIGKAVSGAGGNCEQAFEALRNDPRAVKDGRLPLLRFEIAKHYRELFLPWWNRQREGQLAAANFGGEALPPGAWTTPPAAVPEPAPRASRVSIADLLTCPPPPQRFIWAPRLPAGVVTLLAGHGGTLKSTLALDLAVSVASNLPFLGVEVEQCPVILFSGEDPTTTIRRRLGSICVAREVDPTVLAQHLIVFDATQAPVLYTGGVEPAALTDLKADIATFQPGLVILDNASDIFDGDEIKRAQVRAFMRMLAGIGAASGAAILLLSHIDKAAAKNGSGGEGYSGSTAWNNSARSRWFLSADEEGLLTLEHQKANLSRRAEPLTLRRTDVGVLEVVDTAAAVFDRAQTDAYEIEQVLAHIRAADAAGDPIPAAASGPRTTAKVLSARPAFPPLAPSRVRTIVEQLRGAGSIRAEQIRDRNRNLREVLRAS